VILLALRRQMSEYQRLEHESMRIVGSATFA